MDQVTETVQKYYDENVETEWQRIAGRPEFLMTMRYLKRYMKPGQKVLDIGGGPGRYSVELAKMGCHMTLVDLSPNNVDHAKQKAKEAGVELRALAGDARQVDTLVREQYDHVLLMGPLYHLQKEEERIQAVRAAIKCLRDSGNLYVSFITTTAGIIFAQKFSPEIITAESEKEFMEAFFQKRDFAGLGFTESYMAEATEIVPFMEKFPLETLHLFGQEGILTLQEDNIMKQPEYVINAWLDCSEKVCERDTFLSHSEHLMYIGKKMYEK